MSPTFSASWTRRSRICLTIFLSSSYTKQLNKMIHEHKWEWKHSCQQVAVNNFRKYFAAQKYTISNIHSCFQLNYKNFLWKPANRFHDDRIILFNRKCPIKHLPNIIYMPSEIRQYKMQKRFSPLAQTLSRNHTLEHRLWEIFCLNRYKTRIFTPIIRKKYCSFKCT